MLIYEVCHSLLRSFINVYQSSKTKRTKVNSTNDVRLFTATIRAGLKFTTGQTSIAIPSLERQNIDCSVILFHFTTINQTFNKYYNYIVWVSLRKIKNSNNPWRRITKKCNQNYSSFFSIRNSTSLSTVPLLFFDVILYLPLSQRSFSVSSLVLPRLSISDIRSRVACSNSSNPSFSQISRKAFCIAMESIFN